MRPDLPSLLLLSGVGALLGLEIPDTGTAGLVRLGCFLAAFLVFLLERPGGSRGFFAVCAAQPAVVTATSLPLAAGMEALLLLLLARAAGAGRGEAGHLVPFAGMVAGAILLFTVIGNRVQLTALMAGIGVLTLFALSVSEYRLRRKYLGEAEHEAVQ
jgi:hypothetical protein